MSFVQTRLAVLLAVSSMLTNQQSVLSSVSLNRSTHTTQGRADQRVTTRGPGALGSPAAFPRSDGSLLAAAVSAVTLRSSSHCESEKHSVEAAHAAPRPAHHAASSF